MDATRDQFIRPNCAGCIYVFRDICAHACMCACVCARMCERETTIEEKEATSKVSEQGGYWREERGRGKRCNIILKIKL